MGAVTKVTDKIPVMIDQRDLGRADSLRYNVMSFLREENYDRAVHEIEQFMTKESDFPNFRGRVQRYLEHCASLVRAVEMKRNFPGSNRLTAAKQQDLKLKIKQHIDELVYCLKKVEQVEAHLRLEDIRSTVLIVRAVVFSTIMIALLAFILEASRGMAWNAIVVIDDIFQDFSQWLYLHLG